MLSYWLYRLAGLVVPFIPRRIGYALLGAAAALVYRLSERNRVMIQRNVRQALGADATPQRVDETARGIFRNLLKNYFDLFWLPAQPTDKIAAQIVRSGYENLARALQHGRGLIAVSVHMGNQELMTQIAAITDVRVTVVAEHVKNERVFRYLSSKRQTTGINIIPQDGALKELFRALKRNEAIGLVFDRDVTDSGRVIPFFGKPTKLPDGYAILSLKLGAPVVPVFILRRPDDSYAVHIDEPILPEGRASSDADVTRMMLAVGAVVERYVVEYIDQWVYFHDVWPAQPAEPNGEMQRSIARQTERGPEA